MGNKGNKGISVNNTGTKFDWGALPTSVESYIDRNRPGGPEPVLAEPPPVVVPTTPEPTVPTLAEIRETLAAKAREAAKQEAMRVVWPTPGHYRITSPAGDRSISVNYHSGVDIAAPRNTPVLAMMGGTVVHATFDETLGNNILIRHTNGVHSSYQHLLNNFAVGADDVVTAGQLIGHVGNTGRSFGYHLHFEVRRGRQRNTAINPLAEWHLEDSRRRTPNPNPLFILVNGSFVFNEHFCWDNTVNNIWRN